MIKKNIDKSLTVQIIISQTIESVFIVYVVILISFGDVLHCLPLFLLLIFLFHPRFQIFWDLLVNDGFVLTCYDVEVCIILLDNVFRPYIPIYFFSFIMVLQYFSPARWFVGMVYRIVRYSWLIYNYPLEFLLF